MQDDFDRLLDRRGTGALKWDRRTPEEKRRGIVPLSVADMEFPCARPIQEAVDYKLGQDLARADQARGLIRENPLV